MDADLRALLLETALVAAESVQLVEDGTSGTPRWLLVGEGWELVVYAAPLDGPPPELEQRPRPPTDLFT